MDRAPEQCVCSVIDREYPGSPGYSNRAWLFSTTGPTFWIFWNLLTIVQWLDIPGDSWMSKAFPEKSIEVHRYILSFWIFLIILDSVEHLNMWRSVFVSKFVSSSKQPGIFKVIVIGANIFNNRSQKTFCRSICCLGIWMGEAWSR